jgi:hypothetical protein
MCAVSTCSHNAILVLPPDNMLRLQAESSLVQFTDAQLTLLEAMFP